MKSSDQGNITSSWDGVERREYFRLDDQALLGVEIAANGDAPVAGMNSLQELEQQISTLLYRIDSKDTELSQLLRLMNQKLNRVAGLDLNPDIEIPDKPVDINLSACGIRFITSMDLTAAQFLRLHLVLLPDHHNLTLTARLVALEPTSASDDGQSETIVRAAFLNLQEADQEVLIQHMMQLQRRQMKAAAEQREAQAAAVDNS